MPSLTRIEKALDIFWCSVSKRTEACGFCSGFPVGKCLRFFWTLLQRVRGTWVPSEDFAFGCSWELSPGGRSIWKVEGAWGGRVYLEIGSWRVCPSLLVTLSFLCNWHKPASRETGQAWTRNRQSKPFFLSVFLLDVSLHDQRSSIPSFRATHHRSGFCFLLSARETWYQEVHPIILSAGRNGLRMVAFSGNSLRCLENLDLLGPAASPGTLEVPPLMSTAWAGGSWQVGFFLKLCFHAG